MVWKFIFIIFTIVCVIGCNDDKEKLISKSSLTCSDKCISKSKTGELACKLTSSELQKRKSTVISSLKNQVLEKKELNHGYAFKFSGSDEVVDELIEFVKTERECCDFFMFNLSISGDKSEAWLELTGSEGVKEFIASELGF